MALPIKPLNLHVPMKFYKLSPVLLILLAFLACSPAKSLLKTYDDIVPVRSQKNTKLDTWQNLYFSKEDCKCVQGEEFYMAVKQVSVHSTNLMISLQGGGACWPGMPHCKPKATEEDVLISNFTTELADRLGEAWNQVVIPYCDGSVYMGDTDQDYDGDSKTDHWHHGLKNSVAALRQTKKQFPQASKIFLTGCSAGGYGTISNIRLIRELYPQAIIYVLNESGPGLLKPDQDFWKMLNTNWKLSQLTPENCEKCEGQLIYWYDAVLKDPKIKIGLYSSYMDEVVAQAFLNMEPEAFKTLLLKTTSELNDKYPNQFKRFFINGNSHCVQNRNYEVNGHKFWDWILDFLNEKEGWTDVLE